jgi:hypothetical protein
MEDRLRAYIRPVLRALALGPGPDGIRPPATHQKCGLRDQACYQVLLATVLPVMPSLRSSQQSVVKHSDLLVSLGD